MSWNLLAILKLEGKQGSYTYCQILNALTGENHSPVSLLERSPGEGNGYPHQYFCLENSLDGGAWRATVHRVTKSPTWLSNYTSLHGFHGHASTLGQLSVARATRLWLSPSVKIQMVLMGASWLPVLAQRVCLLCFLFLQLLDTETTEFWRKANWGSNIHSNTDKLSDCGKLSAMCFLSLIHKM